MATKKKNAVGTSVLNNNSAQAQNTEVGTGSGAALANPVLAGPPKPGAPLTPKGFVPMGKVAIMGLKHPLAVQESHVQGVVAELASLASQPFWQGAPGNGMPSPVNAGNLLTVAADWSDERTNAKAWSVYAGDERATNWDAALTALDQLAPALNVYLTANPSQVSAVKATLAFLDARGAVAQRSAVTRNAPKVAAQRATKATKNATLATQVAEAEAAAATARRAGNAIITSPAPAPVSATPAPTSAPPTSATPAPAKGGITLT